MHDRFSKNDEELYRGLRLGNEERDWVKHYLRVADQVLFGREPAPRVVVVEEWQAPSHPPSLTPKKKSAA